MNLVENFPNTKTLVIEKPQYMDLLEQAEYSRGILENLKKNAPTLDKIAITGVPKEEEAEYDKLSSVYRELEIKLIINPQRP